jgi:hypothetical protein
MTLQIKQEYDWRKYMKKVIVLALSLMLILAIAGCGGDSDPAPTSAQASVSTSEPTPESTPEPTPEPRETITIDENILNAFEVIEFGGYDWLVLEKDEEKALLLSLNVLGNVKYHEESVDITWEHSSIRQFLNGDFYNNFFPAEQERIIETDIRNTANPRNGTTGGNNTTDKIFLLSIDEFEKYFGDGELSIPPNLVDTWRSWWLRSPGNSEDKAAMVHGTGQIGIGGVGVIADSGQIRPAMWITY